MTVVIQVAMAEEAEPFLAAAEEVSEPVGIGRSEHRGIVVSGRTHVLVRSGIGMVNAADAAVGAIHRYGAGVRLISAGSAGGLARGIAVGDVVVSDALVNVAADVRPFGYALGQVPGMPERFDIDASLRGAFLAGPGVREGAIGSGEAFVTAALAERLREDFPDLLAVDMESAAIAQVAYNHGVPFVSVRAVSDLCAPDGSEFLTHIDDAAERSARVVLAAL
ncbi:5'-methylthioadenosine/S-adenosylhomocysteine nucleosidase [Microbacterium album]|uniref:adenosylhomocysteine nucleosidase n=1 Tax=Microbacterium album TaxID=2053191 RepID=A0A917MNG6_9MICO|nr:5'-methylthioadenosine/S-adenosylhomocysteine nucleosidase [Microbacterium album]GGH41298.1 5'-methylthioadenosine/S-adenosylhomocysteine nucleosidase [Microbacterium album]